MNNQPATVDVAIIGAGAAGLAAAIFAGEEAERRGAALHIVLLDGARKPGAKILVSGGGRCNVTNERVTPDDYCGGSPNIIRNVLRSFDEERTRDWMESLGVPLKLEPTGKYFPESDSARTVLEALMRRVDELGIEKRFGERVTAIDRAEGASHWTVQVEGSSATLRARRLVIATGGRALPKSGSDGAAYPWLTALGHSIVTPVPALAPLVLDERGVAGSHLSRAFADLSGITLFARLDFCVDNRSVASVTESLLFTHFGLSGPAAMNMSRHIARHRQSNPKADPGVLLFGLPRWKTLDEADQWLQQQIKRQPRATVLTTLTGQMPERLAGVLAGRLAGLPVGALTREDRRHLATMLTAAPLWVNGDRGYSFAEATAGGVELGEINWRTMESRKAEGLYLCGEVLDVDGRIGGFNFQWAWSSGRTAGIGVVAALG